MIELGTIRVLDPDTLEILCNFFGACFFTFAYFDSRLALREGSEDIQFLNEALQETYDLAIIESDYAKDDGVTVYAVGLGTEDATENDPYQNVFQFQRIKSILLRRLANDAEVINDPPFPSLPNNPTHPLGTYYQTPNPDDLAALFQTVALKLRVRMVQ